MPHAPPLPPTRTHHPTPTPPPFNPPSTTTCLQLEHAGVELGAEAGQVLEEGGLLQRVPLQQRVQEFQPPQQHVALRAQGVVGAKDERIPSVVVMFIELGINKWVMQDVQQLTLKAPRQTNLSGRTLQRPLLLAWKHSQ